MIAVITRGSAIRRIQGVPADIMTNELKEELLASGVTLHEFVANSLADRIKAGEWTVGSALPSESVFCRFYDVSRHTLRHALSTLEAQGLILRRQGAPTRIISRQPAIRYVQSVESPSALLRYSGNTYRENEIEEHVVCDAELAEVLGVPAGSNWFHIGGARREQDSHQVVSYSDIYILPKFSDLVKAQDHSRAMVYEQIERRFGVQVERATVDLYATGLPARLTKSMQVSRDTPCLVVVRRYFDHDGNLFEISVTHHPEQRFVYSLEYRRSDLTKT
ncbi:MAG: GntR family transcriptional regulator [Burkholderiaceae bacterium]|nr:GntR family transcriptional regulator [Burkholderiaceae bacterium]